MLANQLQYWIQVKYFLLITVTESHDITWQSHLNLAKETFTYHSFQLPRQCDGVINHTVMADLQPSHKEHALLAQLPTWCWTDSATSAPWVFWTSQEHMAAKRCSRNPHSWQNMSGTAMLHSSCMSQEDIKGHNPVTCLSLYVLQKQMKITTMMRKTTLPSLPVLSDSMLLQPAYHPTSTPWAQMDKRSTSPKGGFNWSGTPPLSKQLAMDHFMCAQRY